MSILKTVVKFFQPIVVPKPEPEIVRNDYSEFDFAQEMKCKFQGLPTAFVVDEKEGNCLMYDEMRILIQNGRAYGMQYFFKGRRIFVQALDVRLADVSTLTLHLPGKGRIPFAIKS